jgi:hypothetical protein
VLVAMVLPAAAKQIRDTLGSPDAMVFPPDFHN